MKKHLGHLSAFLTIFIWGTTFISTKVLLKDFQPIEILVIRFVIGFIILCMISYQPIKTNQLKEEMLFVMAGLCGICLYYLLENIALTYTFATHVGIIISTAPFFTAILSHLFMKSDERLEINFFIGFIIAMIGITLISFNENELEFNLLGDILALFASLIWAIYSILSKKISHLDYSIIDSTRHIFFYGLLFMIPISIYWGFHLNLSYIISPINLINLIYLGIGASALCFITWNYSVKNLGTIKTSIYIYVVPVITVITSAFILHEKITMISILGVLLTLGGLIISQIRFRKDDKNELRK